MAAPDNMADMTGGSATTSFVRRCEATVAGLVCITTDGVMLRAGTADQVQVRAVSVEFATQDAAVFRVPSDYVRGTPGTAQ